MPQLTLSDRLSPSIDALQKDRSIASAAPQAGFANGSASESGLCTRGLLLRTPYLQFFGNKSFLWSPTVHSAAIRTLGKCNSIRQLIDLRKIDIDVRRDQSFRTWTFEHQLRQRNLQTLREDAKSLAGVAVVPGVPLGDEYFDRTCIIVI